MFLLDTCVLLWWTLQPECLSADATKACSAVTRSGGLVSSVSLWEIGVKWKRGALCLGRLDLREYVSRLAEIEGLEIVPVTGPIWVESVLLDWTNRDPADRIVVATARMRDIPIVTKDRVIAGYYEKVVW